MEGLSGIMRGMSKEFRTVARVLFSIVILGVIGFLALRLEYSVPTPEHWPRNFEIHTQAVTGLSSVVDSETGDTLFRYLGNSPDVQPVNVERVDGGRWVVTLEKPNY